MISIKEFKALPIDAQVDELSRNAVSLDLFQVKKGAEVVLFSLNDFYVELYVERVSDEIIRINAFDSVKRLDAYLGQIDIHEITGLISY
jgi:hypothetical protein